MNLNPLFDQLARQYAIERSIHNELISALRVLEQAAGLINTSAAEGTERKDLIAALEYARHVLAKAES